MSVHTAIVLAVLGAVGLVVWALVVTRQTGPDGVRETTVQRGARLLAEAILDAVRSVARGAAIALGALLVVAVLGSWALGQAADGVHAVEHAVTHNVVSSSLSDLFGGSK